MSITNLDTNETTYLDSPNEHLHAANTNSVEMSRLLEINDERVGTKASAFPRQIWVRVEYVQIGDIDTVNEKYWAEVKIKSKWYDEGDFTQYDKKLHWNPKLYIENSIEDKLKEDIIYAVAREDGKTVVTENRLVKGYFWERMELNDFPQDIQELGVTLASKYSTRRVIFDQDPKYISKIQTEALNTFRDQQKWKLYKKLDYDVDKASYDISIKKKRQFQALVLNSKPSQEFHNISFSNTARPKFTVKIYASRKPDFYLINCFSFNLLITSLSLTLFLMDVRSPHIRITGTFTLILTSVSFRWTTAKILPTLAYLTSLDKYQITLIGYLALCCVWHAIFATLDFDLPKKEVLNKIGTIVFVTIFIAIQFVFLIGLLKGRQKLMKLKKENAIYLADLEKKSDFSNISDEEDWD